MTIYFLVCCIMGLLFPSTILRAEHEGVSNLASTLKKEYYVNKLREPSTDFTTKLSYLDSLEKSTILVPGELMKEKTDIYISSGQYQKAVETLSTIIDKKDLPTDSLLFALYNLAYVRQALGNYEKALDNIFMIETVEKPDSLLSYKLYSDFLLARIYRVVGQYAKSDTILLRARQLIPKLETDSASRYELIYKWLLERASAYLDAKDYDNALAALKETSNYNMDKESASLVLMSKAELYHHIGEAKIAEDYYTTFINESPSSINRIYALNNYGTFLVDEKRYPEAADLCRQQIEYADKNGISHVKASLHMTLAKALYGEGKYKEAYEAYNTFYLLIDSLLYSVSPRITKEYEEKVRSRQGNHLSQGSNPSSWKVISIALIAGILIIGATLAVTIIRLKKKQMALNNLASLPQTDEINREYLSLTLRLAELSRVMENIYEIALDTTKTEKERSAEITNLRNLHSANQNFWDIFQVSFERVHPNFIANIRKKHPDLTKGEIRMCTFIVIGLTSKEIAMLTSRSTRTVESMKYRLSKKLGMTPGQSLENYLNSFMV